MRGSPLPYPRQALQDSVQASKARVLVLDGPSLYFMAMLHTDSENVHLGALRAVKELVRALVDKQTGRALTAYDGSPLQLWVGCAGPATLYIFRLPYWQPAMHPWEAYIHWLTIRCLSAVMDRSWKGWAPSSPRRSHAESHASGTRP